MIIARVKKAFRHVNTGITWEAGSVFDGGEEQACELARRGYVAFETITDPEPEEPEHEGSEKELEDMTVAELKALCEEYGIPAPSKAKKDNLVAAVRLYRSEADVEGEDQEGE